MTDNEIAEMAEHSRLMRRLDQQDEERRRNKPTPPSCWLDTRAIAAQAVPGSL